MPAFKVFEREKTLKDRGKAEMVHDENNLLCLTEDYLRELCAENHQYETPALNDTLYLHFKGFHKLECLEKYTNLKSIWLEANGLQSIQGLENQKKLRMIYLQNNCISKIENLNHLSRLVNINLSNNRIKLIEGLVGLNELRSIDLLGNILPDTASCEELQQLPRLTSIDLTGNQIIDHDNVISFFSKLKKLASLKLKNNPAVRKISMYKKNMISNCKKLTYLDDRPIMECERVMADAFARGGKEEEDRVRQKNKEDKINKDKANRAFTDKLIERGKIQRKVTLNRMLNDRKAEKDEMMKSKEDFENQLKSVKDFETKQKLLSKVKFIEDELQTEFYDILRHEESKDDLPSVVPEFVMHPAINAEFEKKRLEDEERIAGIKRNAAERQSELAELDQECDTNMNQLNERQEEIRRQLQAEYDHRERGKSSAVIPSAIPRARDGYNSGDSSEKIAGAAPTTDSESESEFQNKIRGNRLLAPFKWNSEKEELLEDILIQHCFDFKAASREFIRTVNKDEPNNFYKLDIKTLQLRWTDVEIRKYRLNDMGNDKSDEEYNSTDEELPPLDQMNTERTTADSNLSFTRSEERKASSDIKDLKRQVEADEEVESKNPVKSNIVAYNDGTTSEEDGNGDSGPEYNDLEGLD